MKPKPRPTPSVHRQQRVRGAAQRNALNAKLAAKLASADEDIRKIEEEKNQVSKAHEQLQAILTDAAATRAKWEAELARLATQHDQARVRTAEGEVIRNRLGGEFGPTGDLLRLHETDPGGTAANREPVQHGGIRPSVANETLGPRQQLEREKNLSAVARSKWTAETAAMAESRRKFEQETQFWAEERSKLHCEAERLMDFQEQLQLEKSAATAARLDWEAKIAELSAKQVAIDDALARAYRAAEIAGAKHTELLAPAAAHRPHLSAPPATVELTVVLKGDSATTITDRERFARPATNSAVASQTALKSVVKTAEPATPPIKHGQRSLVILIVAFMLLTGFAVGAMASALLWNF